MRGPRTRRALVEHPAVLSSWVRSFGSSATSKCFCFTCFLLLLSFWRGFRTSLLPAVTGLTAFSAVFLRLALAASNLILLSRISRGMLARVSITHLCRASARTSRGFVVGSSSPKKKSRFMKRLEQLQEQAMQMQEQQRRQQGGGAKKGGAKGGANRGPKGR